jgi:hypothetical protein
MTANFLSLYFVCAVGIAISVLLPLVRDQLPKPRALVSTPPPLIRNYFFVALFSVITALILMAFARETVTKWVWYDALLAGYVWDSTLQKMA